MPASGAICLRNISPRDWEGSSAATSTRNACGPWSVSTTTVVTGSGLSCAQALDASSRAAAMAGKYLSMRRCYSLAANRVCPPPAISANIFLGEPCPALGIQDGDLGREFALGPISRTNGDTLTLPQFPYPAAPERLHVDEDVRRIGAPRNEAIALAAIEPFDHGFEGRALRLGQIARRMLCGGRLGRSGRVIEGQEALCLEPTGTLNCFADDQGALIGRFEARLSDAGLMKQDVALRASGRLDEAVSLGQIEPFDEAAHFEA